MNQPQNSHHCTDCYQLGGQVMRYALTYSIIGGHNWEHEFPCRKSRDEWEQTFKSFITNVSRFKLVENVYVLDC